MQISAGLATCRTAFHILVASSLPEKPASFAGHYNVIYIGDRVKRGQLNGKSANLNHAIVNHVYPGNPSLQDISEHDILMIMDCDHMVKPDIFLKMGACMLDTNVAVTLVPQVRLPDLMRWLIGCLSNPECARCSTW